jgi:hypothetical protein
MDTLTSQGVEAFRNGDIDQARSLFQRAIDANPRNADALLWLSQLTEDDAERADYFKQILDISPKNVTAQRGLAYLKQRSEMAAAIARGKKPQAVVRRRATRGQLSLGQRIVGFAIRNPRVVLALLLVVAAFVAVTVLINNNNARLAAQATLPRPTSIPLENLIAFVSDRRGSPELYIGQASGASEPRRLTTDEQTEVDPLWSPDGNLIALRSPPRRIAPTCTSTTPIARRTHRSQPASRSINR